MFQLYLLAIEATIEQFNAAEDVAPSDAEVGYVDGAIEARGNGLQRRTAVTGSADAVARLQAKATANGFKVFVLEDPESYSEITDDIIEGQQ